VQEEEQRVRKISLDGERDMRVFTGSRRYAMAIGSVFIGSLCVICGCCSAPKDYMLITNRLRVFETGITFPKTNVFRLAVCKGNRRTSLLLDNVKVQKGTLSFRGVDGSLSFTTNNLMVFRKNGQNDVIVPQQEVWFRLWEYPQSISTRGVYKDDAFSPYLIVSSSNGYWLVDIPFSRSSDFEGCMGRLLIVPNWY